MSLLLMEQNITSIDYSIFDRLLPVQVFALGEVRSNSNVINLTLWVETGFGDIRSSVVRGVRNVKSLASNSKN